MFMRMKSLASVFVSVFCLTILLTACVDDPKPTSINLDKAYVGADKQADAIEKMITVVTKQIVTGTTDKEINTILSKHFVPLPYEKFTARKYVLYFDKSALGKIENFDTTFNKATLIEKYDPVSLEDTSLLYHKEIGAELIVTFSGDSETAGQFGSYTLHYLDPDQVRVNVKEPVIFTLSRNAH
jgi:hypothetical protein